VYENLVLIKRYDHPTDRFLDAHYWRAISLREVDAFLKPFRGNAMLFEENWSVILRAFAA
jgi:hypothetical protein